MGSFKLPVLTDAVSRRQRVGKKASFYRSTLTRRMPDSPEQRQPGAGSGRHGTHGQGTTLEQAPVPSKRYYS